MPRPTPDLAIELRPPDRASAAATPAAWKSPSRTSPRRRPRSGRDDTTSELRVAIGRTGATKLQYLAIGKGTRQHALIAGKTGSGKSTLFHVIITNLALWCSPEQVEFYLVDFKKGVEFKCYAAHRLPHARVVAIESDREFGLSVLQRVDDELKRRGDLFRKLGVQDIAGLQARRRHGADAALAADRLMSSRSSSSRTTRSPRPRRCCWTASSARAAPSASTCCSARRPSAAPTPLARTTLGQMVIRIALQCNEADAYLIMDDNNPAPRLLSRPGEGIYNDTAGVLEGNSPFQVVWLPDDGPRPLTWTRSAQRADRDRQALPGPIVFEGNAPADVRENAAPAAAARSASPPAPPPRAHLARRAQFHQRPDRGRLPPAKRQQPAHRRPARGGVARDPRRSPCCPWPRSIPSAPRDSSSSTARPPGTPDARFPRPRPRSHPARGRIVAKPATSPTS